MIQHRRAQLMQCRERQLHLRLHARCPRHQASRRPPGQVVQQHGLAHARLTAHHQGPALTGPHADNEPVKHATFAEPARQLCCGPPDTRMCRHRPGARKQPRRRHRLLGHDGTGTPRCGRPATHERSHGLPGGHHQRPPVSLLGGTEPRKPGARPLLMGDLRRVRSPSAGPLLAGALGDRAVSQHHNAGSAWCR
jgi:hypothetical protein